MNRLDSLNSNNLSCSSELSKVFINNNESVIQIRSDTESTGRYSRTEVDTGKNGGRPKISFSQLFKRNKDKVSGADTDTVRTVVTMEDEKVNIMRHHV